MASVTVRKIDERDKARLRVRAARNGRSLEEELRQILKRAANETDQMAPEPKARPEPDNVADGISAIFGRIGGVELELPRRTFNREPPKPG
jgi:phosphopantothenoylcysteine decarboxylase/phosphopantothenate--cysteine ligase